jgi:hypothetical protein
VHLRKFQELSGAKGRSAKTKSNSRSVVALPLPTFLLWGSRGGYCYDILSRNCALLLELVLLIPSRSTIEDLTAFRSVRRHQHQAADDLAGLELLKRIVDRRERPLADRKIGDALAARRKRDVFRSYRALIYRGKKFGRKQPLAVACVNSIYWKSIRFIPFWFKRRRCAGIEF